MKRIALLTGATLLACGAGTASAEPVDGWYYDLFTQDIHGDLRAVEEIGNGFPPEELIITEWFYTDQTACPLNDDPNMPNFVIEMWNLTGRYWDNLFYVADPETFVSNFDGAAWSVNAPGIDTLAFRIDWLGINTNLIFESLNFDNVLEPGEMWQFIVQDYTNAFGLPPSAFGSFDFAGASSGDTLSSGSIVQFVPAPGPLSAALIFGGALAARRRRG